jgi:hypothetical protein
MVISFHFNVGALYSGTYILAMFAVAFSESNICAGSLLRQTLSCRIPLDLIKRDLRSPSSIIICIDLHSQFAQHLMPLSKMAYICRGAFVEPDEALQWWIGSG